MKNKKLVFSSFILKIIALATMTIDHIGAIVLYNSGGALGYVYLIFRLIGRIAFPLFMFMIVEGILHTHRPWRYFLRLAISGVFIGVATWISVLLSGERMIDGNIFVSLLGVAFAVWALRQKKYLKMLALIPIAFFFLDFALDFGSGFPYASPQYGLYGLTMGLLFYASYLIIRKTGKAACEKYQIDYEGYLLSDQYRWNANAAASISLLTTNVVWYIIAGIDPALDIVNITFQSISILTGIILLYYNGKRGYDAKWFRYGTYAYYPLHIILLYLLSFLVVTL